MANELLFSPFLSVLKVVIILLEKSEVHASAIDFFLLSVITCADTISVAGCYVTCPL